MDAHLKGAVSRGLALKGVDVLTAQDDGNDSLEDGLLRLRATELNRILVTQDEDFIGIAKRLTEERIPFTGVIYLHQNRLSIGELIHQLEVVAGASDMAEWSSRLLYLPI
jgi:predicted nuclease of predicted toxin-antitoxin system